MPALANEMGAVAWRSRRSGLLYTAGAVIYATQRPDPSPQVFGYHEGLPCPGGRSRGRSFRGCRVLRAAERLTASRQKSDGCGGAAGSRVQFPVVARPPVH